MLQDDQDKYCDYLWMNYGLCCLFYDIRILNPRAHFKSWLSVCLGEFCLLTRNVPGIFYGFFGRVWGSSPIFGGCLGGEVFFKVLFVQIVQGYNSCWLVM
eukprot:TRINITY_DN35227_c0_g1_i1.p1 TRINITY_DN35227_c0_g1~~TRINITY_DN35227_c0_g1_i1.p1  ORF type:complete len:100 (+),score=0.97 TRINITY_DN35227_c0_g1_i1:223-522(+)